MKSNLFLCAGSSTNTDTHTYMDRLADTHTYKIFRIYLVYAPALFFAAIYKFSSIKPVPKKSEQIKTEVKIKIKIKIKHIPQGYAVRHLASWATFNNLHTDNVCTSAWLSMCVCVCVSYYSAGKLPMYVMQFCCSLTAPDPTESDLRLGSVLRLCCPCFPR